jgi:hypothetical protein
MGETLFESVSLFFQQDNWPISQVEGQPAIKMRFQGKNGIWNCLIEVQEARQLIIFYSALPVVVPEARRMALGEYLMRANFGLTTGNFELDFEEGEARFRTSIVAADGSISQVMVKTLVYLNLLTMDRYLPGLLAVMDGNVEPAAAIAQIEGR